MACTQGAYRSKHSIRAFMYHLVNLIVIPLHIHVYQGILVNRAYRATGVHTGRAYRATGVHTFNTI